MTASAKPTPLLLELTFDGPNYVIAVTGAKPITLGPDEAARLGRELLGDRTPPHVDPPEFWQDEAALVEADEEPADEGDDSVPA